MLPVKQVLQTLILFLLILKVRSDDLLIGPDRGDKLASGPELMTDKVSLLVGHILSHPDRTFTFEKAHSRCHTMFRGNGHEQMHMIRHEMTRFNRALFLLRQPVQDISQLIFKGLGWNRINFKYL